MSAPRSRGVAAALLATGLALGGCSQGEPPTPAAVTTDEVVPALTSESAENVLASVATTLAEADEAKDPSRLEPRLSEPARGMRAGQYEAAKLTEDRLAVPSLSTTPQTLYVPQTEDHPRTLMSVTQAPADGNLPQLLALQQASAREPYKLWGWAELFPGVTVPALAAPEVGAETLPGDAEGLVATPADALSRYAATLEDVDGADAGAFTPMDADPFKQRHRRLEDGLGPQLTAAGEVDSQARVAGRDEPVAPVSLRTADGGALVLGQLSTMEKITRTEPDSKIDLSGDYIDFLGGNGSVVGSVGFTYGTTVALYVPPADAEDTTIQVLGATTTLTDAMRDDAANPDQ